MRNDEEERTVKQYNKLVRDKMEVIFAVIRSRGYTLEAVETLRLQKASARGAFDKRILLIEAEEA